MQSDIGSGIDIDECHWYILPGWIELEVEYPTFWEADWGFIDPFPPAGLEPGTYQLVYQITDNAGNAIDNFSDLYTFYVTQSGSSTTTSTISTTTTIPSVLDPPANVYVDIEYSTDGDCSDGDCGLNSAFIQFSWSSVSGATKYRWKIGTGSWHEVTGTSTIEMLYWWYVEDTFYVQAGNSAGWSSSATKAFTVDISNVDLDFWKDSIDSWAGLIVLTIDGTVSSSSGSKPGSYIRDLVNCYWGDGHSDMWKPLFFPKGHGYEEPGTYDVALQAFDNYGSWRKIRKTISVQWE